MKKKWNRRKSSLISFSIVFFLLFGVVLSGLFLSGRAMETDFSQKNLPPSPASLFGTDWMGRDMLSRTLSGLSLSIQIGLLTAAASSVIALILGTAAALNRRIDAAVSWLIDLFMGIPHILLVMLISLAFGKGFAGVAAGISLSHWPSLSRVIRGEILQLRNAPYLLAAEKLGVPRLQLILRHIFPHLFPQFLTGFILQFPHAILHEASITFLGFGLPPEQPAIGIILSESMRYLTTGKWWLALFPGISLVLVVISFSFMGEQLRRLTTPASIHQ